MDALYRFLLNLYPAAFRNEYGDEMTRVFKARRRESNSLPGLLWLWLAMLPDLALGAVREHLDILRQDVRYAGRALWRTPMFALTAVLVIALGVGANTAIFSVVDVALIRPLPLRDPDRLVELWEDYSHYGYTTMEPSIPNYFDWKRMNKSFETVAAFRGAWLDLTGVGRPERLEGAAIGADLFPTLGIQPLMGRFFTPEEEPDAGPRVVILSYGLWQRRFGGDAGILGRKLVLDGAPWEVVGVMPASFHFPRPDVVFWMPLRYLPNEMQERNNHYLNVLARLKPGVDLTQARADMNLVASNLQRAYPKEDGHAGILIEPLRDEVGERSLLLLMVLLAAAGAVLLIGCANLANLLLARANVRRRELAIRAMLGAGAERLRRQVLTESVLLSLTGGLFGLILASLLMPLVANLAPASLPIGDSIRLDSRVLAFGLALSFLTGIAFGILPALQSGRESLSATAKEGGRDGIGAGKGIFRGALVIGEVAISVMLVVCAGLLIRAFQQIQRQDPGFQSSGLLTMRTYLPVPKYESLPPRREFYRRVLSQVKALPGVDGAAYVSFLPLTMRGGIFPVSVNGRAELVTQMGADALMRQVTLGYFSIMRIPLLAGRDVTGQDNLKSLRVAVVSASFGREFFPNLYPIGQRFRFLDEERTIVGIVGDVRLRGLERVAEPQVYLPYGQFDMKYAFYAPKDLVIRTRLDPASSIASAERAVWSADPDQPISNVTTMTDILNEETSGRRDQLRLLGLFTGLAYFLAALGIYGVLSFLAGRRTQEIGVRIALGARPVSVLWLILKRGLILSGAGLVLGLLFAWLAALAMQGLLFGVKPADPLAFTAGAGLCLLASLLAAAIPALRAARVDPVSAIRWE